MEAHTAAIDEAKKLGAGLLKPDGGNEGLLARLLKRQMERQEEQRAAEVAMKAGTVLPETKKAKVGMKCSNCLAELAEDAKFCGQCGQVAMKAGTVLPETKKASPKKPLKKTATKKAAATQKKATVKKMVTKKNATSVAPKRRREPEKSEKSKEPKKSKKLEKSTQEDDSRRECEVCGDVKVVSEFGPAVTAQCDHLRKVCKECMAKTIRMEVNGKGNFGDILCPHVGCGGVLGHADVQREADAEVFERYDSLLTRRALEKDPAFCWCAHGCGSGQFLYEVPGPNDFMTCQHCRERTCAHHRCAWHAGRSCAKYDADAQRSDEVALLQYLEREGTVRCPKCKHGIEKRSGCDHMTCSKRASGCGHEFCFRCGADYNGPRGIHAVGNHAHKKSCRHYFPPPRKRR